MDETQIKRSLDIFWNGRIVGRYDLLDDGSELFSYDGSYLESADAAPISHSLPLRADPYGKRQLRPFFAGLLPEESQRQRIAAYLGLAESDDFSMLEAIGGECAGALEIIPHGKSPHGSAEALSPCGEDRLFEIVKSLPYRPMLAGESGLRLSLAGAQSKLPVVFRDGHFYLPENGTPSTHILKPELSEWFKGIVANEHCCMTLARAIGIQAAETRIINIGDIPCLLVTRYDRTVDSISGMTRRIHQEDFCQALGVSGEMKYENEGGPSFASCMKAMQEMKFSLADRLAFIDRMIFNFLIGNADAHGKNSSILYRQKGGRSLAPIYDVMSTLVYPALSDDGAMSIGGAKRFADVRRENFALMAREAGMRPALALGRLDAIASQMLHHAESLAQELATEWPSDVYAKIISVISSQLMQIAD